MTEADDICASTSSSAEFSDAPTQANSYNSISAATTRTPSTCSQKSSVASSFNSPSSMCSFLEAKYYSKRIEEAGELPKKNLPSDDETSTTAKAMAQSNFNDLTHDITKQPRMYARNAIIDFPRQTNGARASYKADLRVRVRTIGLIGALLPGIGCYLCIIYSYLFQFENVSNFTSTTCADLYSPFPPVSFSIGVWKPQKYFWLVILTIHFPPRLLFGYVYKSQYRLGESEYRSRSWFPKMIRLQVRVMFLEAVGLIVLSIFDMETYFLIHAIAFGVWLTSFNFNMLFNCILHYHSGIRDLTITHKNIFYIKCTIFLIAYPFSWSTLFSYFSYVVFCSGLAFALFAIAEYVLIGCNCLFYFLLVWELTGSRLEFFVTHKNCTTRTELDVI